MANQSTSTSASASASTSGKPAVNPDTELTSYKSIQDDATLNTPAWRKLMQRIETFVRENEKDCAKTPRLLSKSNWKSLMEIFCEEHAPEIWSSKRKGGQDGRQEDGAIDTDKCLTWPEDNSAILPLAFYAIKKFCSTYYRKKRIADAADVEEDGKASIATPPAKKVKTGPIGSNSNAATAKKDPVKASSQVAKPVAAKMPKVLASVEDSQMLDAGNDESDEKGDADDEGQEQESTSGEESGEDGMSSAEDAAAANRKDTFRAIREKFSFGHSAGREPAMAKKPSAPTSSYVKKDIDFTLGTQQVSRPRSSASKDSNKFLPASGLTTQRLGGNAAETAKLPKLDDKNTSDKGASENIGALKRKSIFNSNDDDIEDSLFVRSSEPDKTVHEHGAGITGSTEHFAGDREQPSKVKKMVNRQPGTDFVEHGSRLSLGSPFAATVHSMSSTVPQPSFVFVIAVGDNTRLPKTLLELSVDIDFISFYGALLLAVSGSTKSELISLHHCTVSVEGLESSYQLNLQDAGRDKIWRRILGKVSALPDDGDREVTVTFE